MYEYTWTILEYIWRRRSREHERVGAGEGTKSNSERTRDTLAHMRRRACGDPQALEATVGIRTSAGGGNTNKKPSSADHALGNLFSRSALFSPFLSVSLRALYSTPEHWS